MLTLENDSLKIEINTEGAELQSILQKESNLEYMWNGDPAFWSKRSPVLFPIVGALKDNTYFYKGQAYQLPRHGFAREMNFSVEEQNQNSITFSITQTEETLRNYPFHFHFYIKYLLEKNQLLVTYGVWNKGEDVMYFSVGAHPAFKLPLAEATEYTDYELQFNEKETAGRWPISKEGLIEKSPNPLLENTDVLPLNKDLFKSDAIVLKQLQSDVVTLQSTKTVHGIRFQFTGFPFLGLWASPGADFLCIEPWCGIADWVDSTQQLQQKEGIRHLQPGELFEVSWKASFF